MATGIERGAISEGFVKQVEGISEAGRLCWKLEVWGNKAAGKGRMGEMEVWAKGSGVLAVSESRDVASYLYATPSEKDKSVN